MRLLLVMTAASLALAACNPWTSSERELAASADAAAARGTPWGGSASASTTGALLVSEPSGLVESADAAAARGTPWSGGAGSPAAAPGGLPTQVASGDEWRAVHCYVFIGLHSNNATPAEQASLQAAMYGWGAAVLRLFNGDQNAAQQAIGSSVNPLMSTPREQVRAASDYCVASAPRG